MDSNGNLLGKNGNSGHYTKDSLYRYDRVAVLSPSYQRHVRTRYAGRGDADRPILLKTPREAVEYVLGRFGGPLDDALEHASRKAAQASMAYEDTPIPDFFDSSRRDNYRKTEQYKTYCYDKFYLPYAIQLARKNNR